MQDRRQSERCPVCQGQLVRDRGGKQRCRTSICPFNHQDVLCPRCGGGNPRVDFKDDSFHYACGDCQKTWSTSAP